MKQKTAKGLNRRKMMLVTGGAVAGASALMAAPFRDEIASGTRTLVANTVGRSFLSLATAGYEEWLAQVGSQFSLGGGTRVQLVGVRALPSAGAKPQGVRRQAFAALFDPLAGRSVAPDLIYTATHSEYGPTPLFLSATSDRRTPGRMIAVFS